MKIEYTVKIVTRVQRVQDDRWFTLKERVDFKILYRTEPVFANQMPCISHDSGRRTILWNTMMRSVIAIVSPRTIQTLGHISLLSRYIACDWTYTVSDCRLQ